MSRLRSGGCAPSCATPGVVMRVPKKSSGVLREGAEVTRKYETIHRQEHSYPVALMCQRGRST